MSLDLSIGYYHIWLNKNESKLWTISLPWEKCCYKNLPIGVANSPDILQQKMNDLYHGFGFICAYIDNIWVLTKRDNTDHVQKLGLSINKLKVKVLKCNIEKLIFSQI